MRSCLPYTQRAAPPPPKTRPPGSQPPSQTSSPASYRPAPPPPAPLTPTLDRSTSQRLPQSKPSKSADQLTRANTTSASRDRRSPGPGHSHGHGQNGQPPPPHVPKPSRSSPGPSGAELPPKRDKRQEPPTPPSAAAQSLQKVSNGVATPRRREKKGDKEKEADIVKRLQAICTDADPTKLYRNLVKIGAG